MSKVQAIEKVWLLQVFKSFCSIDFVETDWFLNIIHCLKIVRIQNFSDPSFLTPGLSTEGYSVSLGI